MSEEISSTFIDDDLQSRKEKGLYRELRTLEGMVDFCSNDYLGLAKSAASPSPDTSSGSTGSRLVSGNSIFIEETEKFIADYHHAEAGLIFNSGYDANLGLFSSVPSKGDIIIYDSLVHASIRDGIRLSHAQSFNFTHNNVDDLRVKLHRLAEAAKRVYVAIESIYSITGEEANLEEIQEACKEFGALLIVDEAHATGIRGPEGRGLVVEQSLEQDIFARVHTFGKAIGANGGIVLGSTSLRSFLINNARSFIYTTALPDWNIQNIRNGYEALADSTAYDLLQDNINYFVSKSRDISYIVTANRAPIQTISMPREQAILVQETCAESRIAIKAMLPPTVPIGQDCIRVCLHAFNTKEEIDLLIEKVQDV